MAERPQGFTGRARRHSNRWLVRWTDEAARWFITISGIGTIVAVLLVFAFLVSVVGPLFWPPPSLTRIAQVQLTGAAPPRVTVVSEYQTLGWSLAEDGALSVFRADTGESLATRELWTGTPATALRWDPQTQLVAAGFPDGSVQLHRVTFATVVQSVSEAPEPLRSMAPGELRGWEEGVGECTPQRQIRLQTVENQDVVRFAMAPGKIVTLELYGEASDGGSSAKGPIVAAACEDGTLAVATTKVNPVTEQLRMGDVGTIRSAERSAVPIRVLLAARGEQMWAAYGDGQLVRYRLEDLKKLRLVEQIDVVEDPQARLTSCEWALGRETLVCGESTGRLHAWFPLRKPVDAAGSGTSAKTETENGDKNRDEGGEQPAAGGDAFRLVKAHELPAGKTAVASLARSERSRLMAAGFADGSIAVYHVTTQQRLVEVASGLKQAVQQVQLTSKEDALIATADRDCVRFAFEPRHPEASLFALFGAVWYEGYERPDHVWQSSFAGVEPEMKLGLWPLVFGTIKATVYSLLFGAPIALLAAIHTSEFMSPKARARLKPAIEMMASLPSVVLGFLAALVMAPAVERSVATILTCFFTVPLTIKVSAVAWQLLPSAWAPHWNRFRVPVIGLAIAMGVAGGWAIAGPAEQLLFAGDLTRWLDSKSGSGIGGWLMLTLPLAGLVVALLVNGVVNPWMRRNWGDRARMLFAFANLGKFVLAAMVAFGLAYGLSALLVGVGWDPRGRLVDTYVQRNALIVGFVMGFAIIPLIYTLADDALTSVPGHLRAASLGCGATPWQTAIRIVIPTAMSGLFSALMIGLGRAVGETMIVLMAGGNTPVMQWNLFGGFRTLSANIAVELPEAVRDSTHYRILFLAALTLFVLTFLVNTAAEVVRIRFRKRATAL